MRPSARLFAVVFAASLAIAAHAQELLVSNYFGDNVSRFSLGTGSFIGNLTGGTLDGTLGTRLGPDGKLYVASELTQSILRYNPTTGAFINTFASGSGLQNPTAITFDKSGNVLVGNFNGNSVAKFSSTGTFLGNLVSSGSGGLNGPDVGTVVGPDNILYVPSFNTNSILKYDPANGNFLGTFVPSGTLELTQPRTILFRNNMVWVTSDSGNKVLRYGLDGHYVDTFVSAGSGGLSGASGMVFGNDGFLYVSSWRNNKVLRYNDSTGAFAGTFISSGLNGPTYLTVVPEPTSMAAIGIGAAGLLRRRSQNLKAAKPSKS